MRIVGLEGCVVRISVERPGGKALMTAMLHPNGIWTWESTDATQLLRVVCSFEDKLLDLANRAGVREELALADTMPEE